MTSVHSYNLHLTVTRFLPIRFVYVATIQWELALTILWDKLYVPSSPASRHLLLLLQTERFFASISFSLVTLNMCLGAIQL